MNIAIINNLYEPFARGGAEKIALIQAEELRKRGNKVIIISLRPCFEKDPLYPGSFYIPSLFPYLDKIPKALRLIWHTVDIFDFITGLKVMKILKENDIDTVITHNTTGIGKIIFLFLKKFKHMHVLHDIALLHPSGLMILGEEKTLDSVFAKLFQRINRYFLKNLKTVISPSAWLLDLHVSRGFFAKSSGKIVISNPLKSEFAPSKPRRSGNKSKLTFIFVGLLSRSKGIELLLEAWKRTKASVKSSAELILIGKLVDRKLLPQIKKTESVRYLGEISNDKVAEYMAGADCLLMPSICYENSPTVIYEARSLGLPVLAANLGGVKELIEMLGGILFSPTEDDLKNQIDRLIDNHGLLIELSATDPKIISKLSAKSYMSRLEEILGS